MNRNITATILIILAVALYFTWTTHAWDEVKAAKAVNDQYASAITNAEHLIELRDKANNAYKSITADDRTKLDKMIPDTVDNIRLIIDLTDIARRNNVTLKNPVASAKASSANQNAAPTKTTGGLANSQKSEGINTPTLGIVSISFGVSTTYEQFIGFMQALEANMRIMDITHLSVSVSDTGLYDFSVQYNAYYLQQ